MDSHKPAADRIRPVLQAMEESIRAARRNRTKDPTGDVAPAPAPLARPVFSAPVKPPVPVAPIGILPPALTPPGSAEPVQRLKAKPKRLSSPFPSPFEQPAYRSQAS